MIINTDTLAFWGLEFGGLGLGIGLQWDPMQRSSLEP